jgi:hypothetical protein
MLDVCCRRTASCKQLASHSRRNCELGNAKPTNFRAFFRLGAKSEEQFTSCSIQWSVKSRSAQTRSQGPRYYSMRAVPAVRRSQSSKSTHLAAPTGRSGQVRSITPPISRRGHEEPDSNLKRARSVLQSTGTGAAAESILPFRS